MTRFTHKGRTAYPRNPLLQCRCKQSARRRMIRRPTQSQNLRRNKRKKLVAVGMCRQSNDRAANSKAMTGRKCTSCGPWWKLYGHATCLFIAVASVPAEVLSPAENIFVAALNTEVILPCACWLDSANHTPHTQSHTIIFIVIDIMSNPTYQSNRVVAQQCTFCL